MDLVTYRRNLKHSSRPMVAVRDGFVILAAGPILAEQDSAECSEMVWLSSGRPNCGRARKFGYLAGGLMVAERDGLVI
jgi:hypothetical protein